MRSTRPRALGLGAAGAVILSLGLALPAHADYAPSGTDIVGIGGDTPQYDLDFGADGDINGNLGYNAANNVNKLVSFDATADLNGRAGYLNGSTLAAPLPLNPTIVLRAGTSPVQRPQSSGAGIAAILADTNHQIDFVRSARQPTAAEQSTAASKGYGYLHVVQLGTDAINVVGTSTPATNAPAGLSASDLIAIYQGTVTQWNQLPGNSGGSAGTIIPLLPPNGSVIRTTFLNDLKAANGGVALVLGSSVQTVEQNDPGAITGTASPANTIAPFSSARLGMYTAGYFHTPSTVFPGGAAIAPNVKPLTGTPAGGGSAYTSTIGHYVLFRQSDAAIATPWQPGSTKNWVQALFSDPSGTPYFKRAAAGALISSAGTTYSYADLGNVSSG
jgi:hypothetical protein